jgi:hemolysin activation/secretion protein
MTALALTPAQLQDAQQQNDTIQREQQMQQQEDTERALKTGRPQTNIQVPAPPLQKGKGEGCRNIKRIMLLGATHMSKKEEHKLTAPYAGKCLGVNEIEKLMSDVTAFYINKGFVTTRIYLPAQDLSTGTLNVQIVPGKVSEIKTDTSKTRINYLGNLFPGVAGHDLNLRDFEQGIDQINRLLSNNATIDIKPGTEPGDSIVTINNKPAAQPWHLNSTLDNYGASNTGRDQVGMTASFDNIAGLEDFTSLGLHKTLPLNENAHQATADNILISVPMGYSTLTFNYNQSNYDSTIHTGNLHLNGDDNAATVTLDHVVYRDQTSKASVNAALTNDITNTFINNQLITVSSRTLTYVTFGGNYSTQIKGGTATLGAGYSRGLRLLNALVDSADIVSSTPHAQFDKYTLNAGYARPFSYDKQNFSFSSQFSGQYAPDALYGSQQISVGGQYTVRGFQDEALANDDGYFLRNDLTWLKTASIKGHTINFRPLVALDVGSVGSVHPGTPHGTLVGAAVGTDLASGPFDFNILGGHPVVRPSSVPDPGLNILSRLSVTF